MGAHRARRVAGALVAVLLIGLWRDSNVTSAARATASAETPPEPRLAVVVINSGIPERTGSHPIAPEFFGMTVGAAGTRSDRAWPGANGISIGTLGKTMGGIWPFVERPEGRYNWGPLDGVIRRAQAYGIKSIVYTFLGVPLFESTDARCVRYGNQPVCAGPPRDQRDFLRFVTALVTRYKGQITSYEMWNEGNRPAMWNASAADLAHLQQATYRIVKSIDPQARVLTASPVLAPNFASWLQEYFQNIQNGGTVFADGVSWHAYHCADVRITCFPGTSCDQNPLDCAGAPLRNQIATIRKTEAAAGIDLPLFDTEGGWQQNRVIGDNPQNQAAYLSRWYIIQASEGIATAIWYGWATGGGRDPASGCPTCPEGWGGIFNESTGQITTAAAAYESTYHWLVGSTMEGPCKPDAQNVWTCALTLASGRSALIVWNGNETAGSYKPARQFVQYQTLDSPAAKSIHPGAAVGIGEEPILLETAGQP